MRVIKCIDDIRNGDLVVTRDGLMFLRVGNTLIDEHGSWILCSGYRFVEGILTNPNQPKKFSGEFDIVEVWKPKCNNYLLSFDLEDRKLVWKEQEQKYYIKHRWSETEFTLLEIEELKEKYNTTLEDFKIIPVKEI